jgi:uncharacterized protein GlcG (DUF336 family)
MTKMRRNTLLTAALLLLLTVVAKPELPVKKALMLRGVPLVHEGKVIGAIGVSGNTPQEDEDIAKAGAANAAAVIGN